MAQSLRDLGQAGPIDEVDFSAEILRRVAEKGIYRALAALQFAVEIAISHLIEVQISAAAIDPDHATDRAQVVLCPAT